MSGLKILEGFNSTNLTISLLSITTASDLILKGLVHWQPQPSSVRIIAQTMRGSASWIKNLSRCREYISDCDSCKCWEYLPDSNDGKRHHKIPDQGKTISSALSTGVAATAGAVAGAVAVVLLLVWLRHRHKRSIVIGEESLAVAASAIATLAQHQHPKDKIAQDMTATTLMSRLRKIEFKRQQVSFMDF